MNICIAFDDGELEFVEVEIVVLIGLIVMVAGLWVVIVGAGRRVLIVVGEEMV